MAGDLAFFFGSALAMIAVGVAFIAYNRPLVRWLAVMNVRYWRDNKSVGIPGPSKSRIRWLEVTSENPDHAPEMIWLMRGMGVFALVLAATFLAGGIGRLI